MKIRPFITAVLPCAVFTLLVVAKLLWARSEMMIDGFSLHALLVELPAVLMFTLAVELLLRRKKRARLAAYLLADVLVSLILFALVIYFQYFGTMATYTDLFSLNQTGEVRESIRTLIRPGFLLLFADLPFVLALTVRRWRDRQPRKSRWTRSGTVCAAALWAASAGIVLVNTLDSIGGVLNEMKKAEGMGLLTYQAYYLYADLKRDYIPVNAITAQAIRAEKQLRWPEEPAGFGAAAGKDVYIVQLESFQNFLIGLEIDGQEVTPNLNDLAEESLYFDRFFQQIAKGNTSDAEFIVNTSLYPTGSLPMSKETAGRKVPSLARLLAEQGYTSVTFHTNEARFWDRHEMYPALGFDRYYDKSYFGEEDVIAFGASDEVLYDKSMDVILELKEEGQRIYAFLVSMSSHNPFELPENKQRLDLPRELAGTFLGNYLQSCHYADYALGGFINALKQNGLWEDALFVVYGDHFGFHDNTPEEEQRLAAELIGVHEYTKVQMFNVPLIIRVPGMEGEVRSNTGGQIDVLPTVANLLGIDLKQSIVFGQDLLNHTDNLIPERVYLPSGSLINEEAMVIPGSGLEDAVVLPLDPFRDPKPAEAYRDDYNRALLLLEMSDAYVHALPVMAGYTPAMDTGGSGSSPGGNASSAPAGSPSEPDPGSEKDPVG